MAYLTLEEIPLYCTTVPGITMDLIETASLLIDAHKGQSFTPKTYTEPSKLSKKRGDYGYVYKGKLKHLPRASIVSVVSYVPSQFGGETMVSYDPMSLRFDEDDSLYFQFVPQNSPNNPFATLPPSQLIVNYTAGYEVIPVDLKRVTGLLAENLKKNGGTFSWKSRDDFDMKITLTDSSIFPMELKKIIDMVKLS